MVRDGGDDDGFLSRWSRRKQAARSEPAAGPELAPPGGAGAEPEPAAAPDAGTVPATGDAAAPGAEAREAQPLEELIEPPSLDLIDKDFDLAHWLKQNVPESWKLAALRRTWETDPFIHGYLNPAREYALDWNTPGGAPGYGPLTESDDVKAMVAQIFGDLPKPESEAGEAGDGAQPDGPILSAQDEAPASEIAALQHETPGGAPDLPLPESPPPQPALQSVRMSEKGGPAARTVDAAPQQEWRDEDHSPPVPRQRRRSGGAIPV